MPKEAITAFINHVKTLLPPDNDIFDLGQIKMTRRDLIISIYGSAILSFGVLSGDKRFDYFIKQVNILKPIIKNVPNP